jgi:hypothetical protein
MTAPKPAVTVRRVQAEPASDSVPTRDAEVAWLALWGDGTIKRYPSARVLLRAAPSRPARGICREPARPRRDLRDHRHLEHPAT